MKEQLIHILDQSVCLSRKQMKEYLSGTMLPEETHAAEVHLSSCPLCSMAMDGFEEHTDEALMAIASLNSGFLKEHFDNISPQIHLNSMAPTASLPSAQSAGRTVSRPALWRVGSVAAAALLIFGILWAFEQRRSRLDLEPAKEMVGGAAGRGNSGGNNQKSLSPGADVSASAGGSSAASSKLPAGGSANLTADNSETQSAAPGSGKDQNMNGTTVAATPPATDHNADASSLPLITPSSSAHKIYKEANPLAEPEVTKKDVRKPDPEPAVNTSETDAIAPAKAATAKPKETQAAAESADETNRTKESYGISSYRSALVKYQREMESEDPKTRDNATLMAAQAHLALGNKERARELLKQLVENGSGSYRRAAKKELKKLD